VSHAFPVGQSLAELQPQAPETHWSPMVFPVQSLHALPELPQVVLMPPVLQVPPEQQPPLHGCEPEQLVVHWCLLVSQALFAGQSLAELQPHPPATQA
jgi:hypothetical protein